MDRQPLNKVYWNGRPVLVTGGAGFIGSWLSRQLLELGARVYILDIKESLPRIGTPYHDLDRAVYVSGDVCDQKLVAELLRKENIRTIFHLAAEAIVGEAYKNPARAFRTNVQGTVAVLEAARVVNPEVEIVIASSDKAYGQHETLPYREDFPLIGRNPYDCTKSCADLAAQSYAATYGSRVGITRCGNVYGGGDLNFSRLIPDSIRSLFLNKSPEIRSDGLYKRDYVHVSDIVKAYIRTAEALIGKKIQAGDAFNFGTNTPRTALGVVQNITAFMGREINPVILATASYEIKDQYLDSAKAREILDWTPTVEFEDGLRDTIDWYSRYLSSEKKN